MQAYNLGRPRWVDPGFYPIQENLIDGFDESEGSVFLIDVGGSIGHDLEDLLRVHPDIPGRLVLQDLPMVLSNITQLSSRIEKMPHDFNNKQPVEREFLTPPLISYPINLSYRRSGLLSTFHPA